ncbi:hypothetical protein B0A80_16225 [Flavobacterium tructae]|uniref:hypothetical protein n=1 Tax=Flavobacterium tructae TaxID=1114873 RepID=UPI000B5C092C|nr:hypothetical protein [Flavobacterium tructae]OXB21881.1 hypothetical protein B0A80_16225 [Flavobacterium tructae]
MILKILSFLILTFSYTSLLGQTSIEKEKLRKPNPNDTFEKIVIDVNNELDSTLFKTDIWISDNSPTCYDLDYGVIINKKDIQEKIKTFENVDLGLLLRIVIAHEKTHAKEFLVINDSWKKEYRKRVHIEQLQKDEVKADLVAGYYAFDYLKLGYVKYLLELIIQIEKNGLENEPKLTNKEIDFTKKIRDDEISSFKLLFQLGENQNLSDSYPNSYQRMSAIEYGMKAAIIRDLSTYLKNPKNKLSNSDKEKLIELIQYYEDAIDYANYNFLYEKDYFYNDYSEKLSRKITHILSNYSKYITIQLLDGKKADESGFAKFGMRFSNANTKDSLRVFYSVLLAGKPDKISSVEYPNYTSMSSTHSSIVLAPKETKIVTDSIFDLSEPFKEYTKFKMIFPGQFGSLYYTELVNQKNSSKYFEKKLLRSNDCSKCSDSIEELLNALYQIQSEFKTNDINDYLNGIGFKNINSEYTEYSIFIKNRPFELLTHPDIKKTILKSTVYRNISESNVKDFLKSVSNKLSKKGIKSSFKNNRIIYLNDDKNVLFGRFEIVYDDIYSEYKIELNLTK